jgi:outer membrane lipoprotein SlyB
MKLSKSHLSARIKMCISAILTIAFINQPAQAACNECGTVTDVKTVKIEGKASGVGAVAGGVLGGVLGHQVGGGTGKDLATIGGAVGGAYVGHQMEKKSKARTEYRVIVEMEDGTSQTFKYSSQTSYQVGDRVIVKNGKLTRP